MTKHRRFADTSGFTCHCWECKHANGWKQDRAKCDVYKIEVEKCDSPNNICSVGRICRRYEGGGR